MVLILNLRDWGGKMGQWEETLANEPDDGSESDSQHPHGRRRELP